MNTGTSSYKNNSELTMRLVGRSGHACRHAGLRYATAMHTASTWAFRLRLAITPLIAAALVACGGGAVFIGDGFGASVNVPPPNGDGDEVLSEVTAEPAGINCARGGSRVDSGIDYNRNRVLDNSEIQTTRYVCDTQAGVARTGVAAGKNGAEVLVSLSPEARGSHCASGGQKVEAGADLNADGALDAAEASSVSYLCAR